MSAKAILHLGEPEKKLKWIYKIPTIFFGLFYNSLAIFYDHITNAISMNLWKEWLATTRPYLEGDLILEIGHGTGRLQKILAKQGKQVFGLEPSWQMIGLTKRRLVSADFPFRLTRGYSQAIPFRDHSFDQIVSTFPAEYITDADTLHEIKRILRSGGKLIILRFAWLSDQHMPYKAIAWLFRLVGEAPQRQKVLPEETLATPFEQAGFTVSIKQIDLENSAVVIICCQVDKG